MTPKVYLAIGVAVASFAAGGLAAHTFYSPRLALAEERLRGLGEKVTEQNEAIEKLQRADADRMKLARAAIAQAALVRANAEQAAKDLMGRQPPPGVNVCEAASNLVREELKR